jgi:hypothetical protein
LIEQRLLQVLPSNRVLPYADLKTRAAIADDRAFRRVVNELLARNLMRRKADHKGLWYVGYAMGQPLDQRVSLDEVPAPFRELLSELIW